jgi:SAM-dependent methyltransferase
MYWVNPVADVKRVARAILTDQVAWLSPSLYVRLTGQTGRGDDEGVARTADYFRTCFDEYFQVPGMPGGPAEAYLDGKHVLEYGPGDLPGVALLMIAHGAQSVICVDRFPLCRFSESCIQVMQNLLDALEDDQRERADQCFLRPGQPASGLNPERIHYMIKPSGLSGLRDWADLVISRAVLEHVNDLRATFVDMRNVLREHGIAVHQVDLKSHGLHRRTPLDFLTWPTSLWTLMYGHKGVPNRWRVDRYRQILAELGLDTVSLEATAFAEQGSIDAVRAYLARPFRELSDEDLSWLGFWLVCCRPAETRH